MSFSRLLILALAPSLTWCDEPNRSWDTLIESLTPGRSVVVTRNNSAQIEGKLVGITPEAITVHWRGQPTAVPRDEVYRVRFANIRRQQTLAAMGVGAAVGALVGAIGPKFNKGAIALGLGGFFGGIGAAVGGALPIGKPLYQVAGPPPRRSASTSRSK